MNHSEEAKQCHFTRPNVNRKDQACNSCLRAGYKTSLMICTICVCACTHVWIIEVICRRLKCIMILTYTHQCLLGFLPPITACWELSCTGSTVDKACELSDQKWTSCPLVSTGEIDWHLSWFATGLGWACYPQTPCSLICITAISIFLLKCRWEEKLGSNEGVLNTCIALPQVLLTPWVCYSEKQG